MNFTEGDKIIMHITGIEYTERTFPWPIILLIMLVVGVLVSQYTQTRKNLENRCSGCVS